MNRTGQLEISLSTSDAGQTRELGRRLAGLLVGGEVIELCGPLGAGKTQFAKGLARGLGVSADEPVVSPTFVLMRQYQGRLLLCHVDAYRLGGLDELADLGLEELLAGGDAVVAIEWADRFARFLDARYFCVELEHGGDRRRRVRITFPDSRSRAAFEGR